MAIRLKRKAIKSKLQCTHVSQQNYRKFMEIFSLDGKILAILFRTKNIHTSIACIFYSASSLNFDTFKYIIEGHFETYRILYWKNCVFNIHNWWEWLEIRKFDILQIMTSIYQEMEKDISWYDGITVFETQSTRYDRKICQRNIVTSRKPVQSSENFYTYSRQI